MIEASDERAPKGGGSRQILVIDDHPQTAAALAAVLARDGYQPHVCHSGHDALAAAQRRLPRAALVDIHLPDINGLIVAQKLREALGPDVPIIVVSGDTSMANLNALRHVGATYFLSKPLSASHLLERLREWLPDAA